MPAWASVRERYPRRCAKSAATFTCALNDPSLTDSVRPWRSAPHRMQDVIEPAASEVVSQRCPPRTEQRSWRTTRSLLISCGTPQDDDALRSEVARRRL